MLGIFSIYLISLIFINYFWYGFFRSLYLAFSVTTAILLLLRGEVITFLIFTFIFSMAYIIFNHSQIHDVRLGFFSRYFLFSCLL